MIELVNMVVKVDKKVKQSFYHLCHSLNLTPMRTMLILIERFANGQIDATPIMSDYATFKEREKITKTNRILKYRIDGGKAYAINQIRKEKEEALLHGNIS